MENRTLGTANATAGNGPRVGPLVISEVMYCPADPPAPGTAVSAAELEYIEIYNPTDAAVDLTRWRLRKGVDFNFPDGRILGAHQTLLVVPFDPVRNTDELARFVARYPGVNTSLLLGPSDGHLDNNGGRIQLQRPDPGGPPADDPTYYPRLIEDEVDYNDVAPWPTAADGNGSSLTRRGTFSWGDDAAAWIAAAPSPGVFCSTVAARKVFYNRSGFDGNDAGANAADDNAVATDKAALLPGAAATFANYTSYTRGINGIMVDLAGAANPAAITAADFTFKVGNDDTPAGWSAAPAPTSVTVRPGAGTGGSDRVTIVWADNAIQNQWLQVTVKATAATGLAADDVFYFGNAVGDSGAGNTPEYALVSPADETAVRTNKTGFAPTAVTNVYDFNRDRRVTASDELTARYLATTPATALRLITPAAGGAALLAMGAPVAPASCLWKVAPASCRWTCIGVLPRSGATASGATGVSPVPTGDASTRRTQPVHRASAHDAALTSASWLWAYEWERIGPRKSSAKKDPAAVSAADRVLATEWV